MIDIKITNRVIELWTDTRSFERGTKYFKEELIYDMHVFDNMLQSKCEGSSFPFYSLWCEIDNQKIIKGKCSCPVGGKGKCKHIVALLLEWKNNPGEFTIGKDILSDLNRLPKKKIIDIILDLMKYNPEIATQIEIRLTHFNEFPDEEYKLKFLKSINKVIPKSYYFDFSEIEAILELFKNQATQFINDGAIVRGISLFQAIIDHISEMYYSHIEDRNGDLALLIDECIDAVHDNYFKINNPKIEEDLMFSLYKACETDLLIGGVDYAWKAIEYIIKLASEMAKKRIISDINNNINSKKKMGEWKLKGYKDIIIKVQ